MTARGLLSVGLKLLGVLCVADAVSYIPALIGLFSLQAEGAPVRSVPVAVAANLTGVVLFGGIAWLLIARSDAVAYWLMPNDTEAPGFSFSGEALQAIAFSVVGIFLVVNAIPQLAAISWNFASFRGRQFGWAREDFFRQNWQAIGSIIIKLLLGLGLFLGSRWLASAWHRWRSIPRPDAVDGDAP